MANACQTHGKRMANAWQTHGKHMANACASTHGTILGSRRSSASTPAPVVMGKAWMSRAERARASGRPLGLTQPAPPRAVPARDAAPATPLSQSRAERGQASGLRLPGKARSAKVRQLSVLAVAGGVVPDMPSSWLSRSQRLGRVADVAAGGPAAPAKRMVPQANLPLPPARKPRLAERGPPLAAPARPAAAARQVRKRPAAAVERGSSKRRCVARAPRPSSEAATAPPGP